MDIYDFTYVLSQLIDIGFKIALIYLLHQYVEVRRIKQ